MAHASITDEYARIAWREHLTIIALSEEECEWEQGEYTEAEHMAFIRGMAMVIGNATWREEEHTGDVEDAAYQALIDAYQTRQAEDKQAQRDRWAHAVASGGTDKGFQEWLADRD